MKWKHCVLLLFISFSTFCCGKSSSSQKPICEKPSPLLLGPLMVLQVDDVPKLTPNTNEFKEWYGPNEDNGYTFVEEGGYCQPHNCISRWPKVAIIVPFRDRGPQLEAFLYHIHPVLQRQQLNYRIFVVEQSPEEQFNRATLMNIGFVEANRVDRDFKCFIFHDVDLLPEDDRNLYICPEEKNQVKHISVAVNKWKYRLQYKNYFGGVTAISKNQMHKINGFSNEFYGWGGEDDDIFHRIQDAKIDVHREPANIARFTMLLHGKEKANKDLKEMMELSKKATHFSKDGLNSLRYDLLKVEVNQLYTRLLVKLPPAPKMEKKKKSWIDTAGGSIKNVVDGAFKNMAGVVADKVVDLAIKADDKNQEEESEVY